MAKIIPIIWKILEKVDLRMFPFFRSSGAAKTRHAWHVARIKALRGKYRRALTPSDEFARRKQEEIAPG